MRRVLRDTWTLGERRPWMLCWPLLWAWVAFTPREARERYIREALNEGREP